MKNLKKRYCQSLVFNQKSFIVYITINKPPDDEGYHYDIELRTKEKISGNEFVVLKKYLEDEGYIDEAIEYYKEI